MKQKTVFSLNIAGGWICQHTEDLVPLVPPAQRGYLFTGFSSLSAAIEWSKNHGVCNGCYGACLTLEDSGRCSECGLESQLCEPSIMEQSNLEFIDLSEKSRLARLMSRKTALVTAFHVGMTSLFPIKENERRAGQCNICAFRGEVCDAPLFFAEQKYLVNITGNYKMLGYHRRNLLPTHVLAGWGECRLLGHVRMDYTQKVCYQCFGLLTTDVEEFVVNSPAFCGQLNVVESKGVIA